MASISQQGIQFICQFEGFSARPYPDPASGGVPYTIGYGTTVYPNGVNVTMADAPVTQAQAEGFVGAHVNANIAGWLNANLPELKQCQFDALCSFAYNLGVGALASSTLLRSIKAGADAATITTDFNMWVNAGGKPMPGLVRRRAAEANLYCNGVYEDVAPAV